MYVATICRYCCRHCCRNDGHIMWIWIWGTSQRY